MKIENYTKFKRRGDYELLKQRWLPLRNFYLVFTSDTDLPIDKVPTFDRVTDNINIVKVDIYKFNHKYYFKFILGPEIYNTVHYQSAILLCDTVLDKDDDSKALIEYKQLLYFPTSYCLEGKLSTAEMNDNISKDSMIAINSSFKLGTNILRLDDDLCFKFLQDTNLLKRPYYESNDLSTLYTS